MRGTWLQARHRFTAFFQRQPKASDILTVKLPLTACFLVGDVLEVKYRPTGKGVDLVHAFGKSKPKLALSADGRQAFLVGGDYRFGDRGFIG